MGIDGEFSRMSSQMDSENLISFEWFLENRMLALRDSGNSFKDILQPIRNRKISDGVSTEESLGIFFYRYTGYDDEDSYIAAMETLHKELLKLNNLYIFYNNMIPINIDEELTNKLTPILGGLPVDIKNVDFESTFKGLNLFNILSSNKINIAFKEAFFSILKEYIKVEPAVNASKVKNFAVKLLSWGEEYLKTLFSEVILQYNPKVVYYGTVKKHEGYFLMLLSLLGCDILVLEPEDNVVWKQIDFGNRMPFQRLGRLQGKITSSRINALNSSIVTRAGENTVAKMLSEECSISVSVRKPLNIFIDIKNSVQERGGYINGLKPMIPVYFCRLIGIENSEFGSDEFYNNIYSLDKELEQNFHNYLRFSDPIEPPQNDEISRVASVLESIFHKLTTIDENFILREIYKSRVLAEFSNKLITNSFKYAFMEVLTLYLSKENTNLSKTKNFLAKLLVYINRYSRILFKEAPEDKYLERSPKILYYGEIKHIEIYLLIYFSRTGCDVLYINSDYKGDELFQGIDAEEKLTKLQKNSISIPLQSFPMEEKLVRKPTAAYEASVEINQILFTPDTGMYKPWQFQDFKTFPVTLKTTFEEISILWEEDAVMRPNFSVASGTVYVPNIYAKINGIHENTVQYRQLVSKLTSAANTCFVAQLPINNFSYTREEMFSLTSLLKADNAVNREELLKMRQYKYSYLKSSLQNFILDKIDELLKSDCFINQMDERFRLKILITALNLPEKILVLLQGFDFPHAVPKLVIYINDKSNFSEEDLIILALLNLMGLDIIILTPTNYNNIENYIKANVFDVHQLPRFDLNFTLNLDSNSKNHKGFLGKLFKR